MKLETIIEQQIEGLPEYDHIPNRETYDSFDEEQKKLLNELWNYDIGLSEGNLDSFLGFIPRSLLRYV